MPRGDRFVEVPAAQMEAHLLGKGLARGVQGREVVYSWETPASRGGAVTTRVYTSIAEGQADARGLGKDAIRVVAFWKHGSASCGVAKAVRVFRTGSVEKIFSRLDARLAEVQETVDRFANRKDKPDFEPCTGEAAKEDRMTDQNTARVEPDVCDDFLADATEPRGSVGPLLTKEQRLAMLLDGLNPEQQAVVLHEGGPLVVQAGAGSGKTKAAVHMIARLILSGVPAEKIVALTFSTKAAGEMNARLRKIGITDARVGTWHSLCLQILKEDRTRWASWKVDDTDRAKIVLKDAIGFKHLNWRGVDFGALRSFLTICKANLWDWTAPEAKALAETKFGKGHEAKLALDAYELFQQLLEQAGLLTFDDFIMFTAAQHLAVEENREAWAGKWDHVIVDEYQDNSRAQNSIMGVLAKTTRNITVIGDKFQAIYKFRGSSPEFIDGFEEAWPGAKRISVMRNYRSGRKIVATANAIIKSAQGATEMVAERDHEGEVSVISAADLDDESSCIARWITRNVELGAKLSDHSILFRLNAQSRAVEEALLKAKIPYLIVGGTSFYGRKEVKDLLGYLRVVLNREAPGDQAGEALRRSINAPFRFLGKAFVARVDALAGSGDWPSVVRKAAEQAGVQQRQRTSAEDWALLIERAREMTRVAARTDLETGETVDREESPSAILNWLVQRTDYIRAIEKEEGSESVESSLGANVRELIRVAFSYGTVREFIDYVDATVKASTKQCRDGQAGGDLVLLMSGHRSKGLQFERVWVVGANETILPHHKGDLEEERRLAYVMATRAQNELVFSWVRQIATRAGMREGVPSRFLIDAGLVSVSDIVSEAEIAAEMGQRAIEGGQV